MRLPARVHLLGGVGAAGAPEGAGMSVGAAEAAPGSMAGGVLPPHATVAPIAAKAARSATIAMFFMIVVLRETREGGW